MVTFLGIDISTSASKVLLLDENGAVLASATHAHTMQNPKPLWAEQDPEEWWHAVSVIIRGLLIKTETAGNSVVAIGLTGQMHGLVLLDYAGKVLRPAILWNDGRTQSQCDEIHDKIGKEKFIQITGNLALTGFTAPKILWVKENEPEVYSRARHVLLPKDYIRYRLTGEYAMDKADGSGTVLFDLVKRDWSDELLGILDIPRTWMPHTFEGTEFTGRVTAEAAEQTGLLTGTPIVAGGGDQATGAVGMGVVEPGIVGLSVGTSGVVFASMRSPLIESEGRLHTFCHALPGMWHSMGVMLSAAGSLQWYRDTIAPGLSFDNLLKEAETVPAGCAGLLYLPYLSGERTPHHDPLARGAFIGLTLRHGRKHMTRAVLEGVAFGLKDCFTLIQDSGKRSITQIRASGGGMKSLLFQQIIASVLETELVTLNTTEGAAYGASLLAAVGAGRWLDVFSACKDTVKITGFCQPVKKDVAIYQQSYALYKNLYPSLKECFGKMG